MVFCPTARGPCLGRVNCRIWIRGRILYTDSKLLAAQLARFVQSQHNLGSLQLINTESRNAFWEKEGISNIRREIITDRYLREKVAEVEKLAQDWIQSPGFHETLPADTPAKTKEPPGLHTQRCKSPP